MSDAFAEGWPADCPPTDAIDAAGVVFRIVDHEPPTTADFVTHFESGRMRGAPPCLRCGLSVFREFRDAIHQRRLFPKIGGLVAQGTLSAEHGKTRLTTGRLPTHTTWWSYATVVRASLFSIAKEEG
jgi:hypothetical protein